MTYSQTEFSDLNINNSKLKQKDNLELSIKVLNNGNFDIDEVVQLYISPTEISGGLPFKSLKAFERVHIPKGEYRLINFTLTPEDLKVINEEGKKIWRNGSYKILVGNCSPSERGKKLGAARPQEALITLK